MSVTRRSLDLELLRQFRRLVPGIVLDVGSKDSPYIDRIPHIRYLRLDIDESSKPDIVCDLHDIRCESDHFDTVIATEVLEHLQDPQRGIDEIHRVLKPGGVCILSTRFLYHYHPTPKDYYRFTRDSLAYLFREFSETDIHHHGNRLIVICQLASVGPLRFLMHLLAPVLARFRFERTSCPCGFVVYAKK